MEYKDEYAQKAEEYLISYGEMGEEIPTIEGLADYLDVSKKSIYNWTNGEKCVASDSFLHAISRIENRQGKELQNKGLSGKFNSTIAKLLLSANHGMKERSDVTTNDKELPIPILGNAIPENISDDKDTRTD